MTAADATGLLGSRSEGLAPADDPEQHDYDRDHEENMDESAHGGGGDQSQEPQDDQDDGDGIKHIRYPFMIEFGFPTSGMRPDRSSLRFGPAIEASALGKYWSNSRLHIRQALCAGVHTPQFFCRTVRPYTGFAPCRSRFCALATRCGEPIEGI